MENLIAKFLSNQASFSELEALEEWIKDPNNEQLFNTYIKTNYAIDYNMKTFEADKVKAELMALMAIEKKFIKLKKWRKKMYYAAAAICIGVLATSYFIKENSVKTNTGVATPVIVNTIEAGANKAILTLADGSVISLEKDNVYKTKNANSNGEQIIYNTTARNTTETTYNYLTIPRGGQFFIKLSDGTQVWLNSESQLKYPVNFKANETRKVELVYGEAYFDVSPSSRHKGAKFKVINKSQNVEVVGTEFNIKAYKDETNIYTTLVEGQVVVGNGILKQHLKPNQQSNLDLESNSISVAKVNVKTEISWKDGIFSFRGKSLKDIMKVISRWYDVDVIFENKKLEDVKFKGVLSKYQDIEEILSIMKSSTIDDYEINNKTIILK